MPVTPYLIYGIVTDTDNNAIEGVYVIANNTTNNAYSVSGKTNSDGYYILDLAEAGYTAGDSINLKVADGMYFGETTFVLSGEGGIEKNLTVDFISKSTVRNKSWLMLYNHLQTGTYAISEDSIFSAMNDKLIETEGYPLVIIEPPIKGDKKLCMNRDGISEISITFNIQVYHTSSENAKVLTDEVEDKISSGWRNLAATGLKNLEILEGDNDWFTDTGKKIHVFNIPVRFRYVSN